MNRVFPLTLAGLLAVVTLGIALLGRDEPVLDAGGQALTDAVVVAAGTTGSGERTVRLRVSDPARALTCTVPAADFAGDPPAVGEVVPVVAGAAGSCRLAELTGVLPRGSLVLTAVLCLAGIGAYAVRVAHRRHRRRGQDRALATYLAQHVAR